MSESGTDHPPTEGRRLPLAGSTREELAGLLEPYVDRPFRARQIWRQIHRRGAADLEQMTDLPLTLRRRLAERFTVGLPAPAGRHEAGDGTVKALLRLEDGVLIEVVDIPDGSRRTLCLSSQAGCPLACQFCVTGYWGGGRNLTAAEIVGQVLALRRPEQESPAGVNLVFMGMGEPLLNLEAVEKALGVLTEFISWRRITVSTVGILPALEKMASWPRRPNLAISLHAPDDERRSRLMPINRVYPLADVLTAVGRWPLAPGRKVTLEYVLIAGFNDAPEDAGLLADRVRGLPVKVNLIPLNHDAVLGDRMRPPSAAAVDAFRRRLVERGLVATVRRRRGDDVSAACGQLRSRERQPRGAAVRRLSI